MTDPKITTPEPVVQALAGVVSWHIPHTTYILPERYRYGRHLFCDAADVEAYAAAREAAARQEERDRLRGYFREALADTGVTWPAEVDILYDKCFSEDGNAG